MSSDRERQFRNIPSRGRRDKEKPQPAPQDVERKGRRDAAYGQASPVHILLATGIKSAAFCFVLLPLRKMVGPSDLAWDHLSGML
ncbi:MAG: hypothetical protein V2A76_12990 [Planctomycetota bacterium]